MQTGLLIFAFVVLVSVVLLSVCVGCRNAVFGGAEAFSDGIVVQYFRMDGCPHCERFDGVWKSLKGQAPPDVDFQEFDAAGPEAKKYGVHAFPHIQMIVDGTPKVFDGPRDVQSLEKFIMGA
jgi:hypothetical protein